MIKMNPRDDEEFRGYRNLDKDYKQGKKKGEEYTDWVRRESDKAFIKFVLWLIFGVPIAIILTAIILTLGSIL